MSDELEEVTAYTRYQWDCGECGDVNESEHDPSGERVECVSCGAEFRVGSSM